MLNIIQNESALQEIQHHLLQRDEWKDVIDKSPEVITVRDKATNSYSKKGAYAHCELSGEARELFKTEMEKLSSELITDKQFQDNIMSHSKARGGTLDIQEALCLLALKNHRKNNADEDLSQRKGTLAIQIQKSYADHIRKEYSKELESALKGARIRVTYDSLETLKKVVLSMRPSIGAGHSAQVSGSNVGQMATGSTSATTASRKPSGRC
jgi:hypothetical protein